MQAIANHPTLQSTKNLGFFYDANKGCLIYTCNGKPTPLPHPHFAWGNRGGSGRGRPHVFVPNPPARSPFACGLDVGLGDHPNPLYDVETRVAVWVTYRFQCPNAHFVNTYRTRELRQVHSTITHPNGQTDLDNLAKFTLDALQHRVLHDDKQVVALYLVKIWCEDPTIDGITTVAINPI